MEEEKIKKAFAVILPDEEAKERMLHNILSEQKSITQIDDRRNSMKKLVTAAAITLAAITVASGSVYAAYRWHQASETAQLLGDDKLAQAFGKTAQELQIIESDKYRIIFLGTVSGDHISKYVEDNDSAQTYAAVAIEKMDGTSMDYNSGLVVSPLIQGLNPKDYNIYSMGGGASSIVEDGVLYCIMSCKDIEMFADRDLYLAVTDGPTYAQAFQYDEDSGVISVNEKYEGMNCLFELPIDASLADEDAAKQYLEEFEKDQETDDEDLHDLDANTPVDMLINSGIIGQDGVVDGVLALGTCVFTKNVLPDKDGTISYSYDIDEYSRGSGTIEPGFKDNSKVDLSSVSGDDINAFCDVLTLNDDGTITVQVYVLDVNDVEKLIEQYQ